MYYCRSALFPPGCQWEQSSKTAKPAAISFGGEEGRTRAFDEIETLLDRFDPIFQAIESPMDANEVFFDGGDSAFDVARIVAQPIDPLVDSAEMARNNAVEFLGHAWIMAR
jgi:hypothetical protein